MPAPKGLRDVQKMVSEHYANERIPAEVARGLAAQLFNGLTSQLISIPKSMRVDSWVTESFPHLVDKQKKMVSRQIQDALGTLRPDVRKVAPEKIVKPSLTMNAAYALFWSLQWHDPLLEMPYRAANLYMAGSRLLEIYNSAPSDPLRDKSLVDAWARVLDLTSIYTWVPY